MGSLSSATESAAVHGEVGPPRHTSTSADARRLRRFFEILLSWDVGVAPGEAPAAANQSQGAREDARAIARVPELDANSMQTRTERERSS
jgi:hypothetical protein